MNLSAEPNTIVFVDADNTLWDTDSVFAGAQRNLLQRVEEAIATTASVDDRLAYVRGVDQTLAELHHAGLRYPPRLLVRALEAALAGMPPDRAARAAWRESSVSELTEASVREIERAFFDDISLSPKVRPGVEDGLKLLWEANCSILVITEGRRARVIETAKKLGLDRFVGRVIEGVKRPELYRRVLRLVPASTHAYMVGDQLDRDIAPAREAGLETIYFPGGFMPRWTPDERLVEPNHVIHNFAEVSPIVLREVACRHGTKTD